MGRMSILTASYEIADMALEARAIQPWFEVRGHSRAECQANLAKNNSEIILIPLRFSALYWDTRLP